MGTGRRRLSRLGKRTGKSGSKRACRPVPAAKPWGDGPRNWGLANPPGPGRSVRTKPFSTFPGRGGPARSPDVGRMAFRAKRRPRPCQLPSCSPLTLRFLNPGGEPRFSRSCLVSCVCWGKPCSGGMSLPPALPLLGWGCGFWKDVSGSGAWHATGWSETSFPGVSPIWGGSRPPTGVTLHIHRRLRRKAPRRARHVRPHDPVFPLGHAGSQRGPGAARPADVLAALV